MNKYKIIYADPPWQYQKKLEGHGKMQMALRHYSTMPIEEIKALNVAELADENCILFLWTTFRKLPWGLDVIKSWGFEYKTLGFSWIKLTKSNTPHRGLGFYTRQNCEVCLIGTKGSTAEMVIAHNVSSTILKQREAHSKKPDEARQFFVELVGDVPRIELFARKKAEGWDSWGDEIVSDIKL